MLLTVTAPRAINSLSDPVNYLDKVSPLFDYNKCILLFFFLLYLMSDNGAHMDA